MYYSDRQTEKELARLENTIVIEYNKAYSELDKKVKDYFASFKERDEEMKKAIVDGSYPIPVGWTAKAYYNQWRLNQLGRGKRWISLRDDVAKRIGNANKQAAMYINGTTPNVYRMNYNYEAYQIDSIAGGFWNIYDENTAKELLEGKNHVEFRTVSVNPVRDYAWNKKEIDSELLSGILLGKSIGELADGYMHVMQNNRTAALRNARTAVTSAQNGGRLEGYRQAEKMGIEIKKRWMSAQDSRVRDSHAHLDGVTVKQDEPFPNGLQYPGDPEGTPGEVYNCRCTMIAILPKYNANLHETENSVESYKKWLKEKKCLAKGALNNKNDPDYKKRDTHAAKYYEEIRNSDKQTFIDAVVKNTSLAKEVIENTYKHIFENKHQLSKGYSYFEPDYDMAESFRRTRTNDNIQKHDLTLYKHENLEYNIMKENPDLSYERAHELAEKKYNYKKELREWKNANIQKRKNK